MNVKYTGNGRTLNGQTIYTVLDHNRWIGKYKIRNDNGRVEWYATVNFYEVKDRVVTSSQTVSSNLISEIEREIKDTEKRMVDLRKKLEDAKNPPTDNILLRHTRKNGRSWIDEVEGAFDDFVCSVDGVIGLRHGLCLSITRDGDGIALDNDYRWELRKDGDGDDMILMILDK